MIVLITNGYSNAYAESARDAGADGTLPKLIGPAKIVAIVEQGMLANNPVEPRPMSLARNTYEHMTRAYVDNDRNIADTAEALDISRNTLYRKLREPAPRR